MNRRSKIIVIQYICKGERTTDDKNFFGSGAGQSWHVCLFCRMGLIGLEGLSYGKVESEPASQPTILAIVTLNFVIFKTSIVILHRDLAEFYIEMQYNADQAGGAVQHANKASLSIIYIAKRQERKRTHEVATLLDLQQRSQPSQYAICLQIPFSIFDPLFQRRLYP